MKNSQQIFKAANFTIRFYRVYSVIALILCIGFLYLININFGIKVQAASTSFGSGSVSLDKYYVNGNTELKSLVAGPGDYLKIRLKYNNTNFASASNVTITDNLPGSKFSYIPASLKNCLIDDQNCIALSDSLFSGQTLNVSPSAGFYGDASNIATGNLELGRLKYAHSVTCSQNSSKNETFIQSIDNASIFIPSCSSVSGSSTIVSYSSVPILGRRYLHQTTCAYSGGEKEIFTQSIDNSSSYSPSCTGYSGATVESSQTFDLLGNRYLHQVVCSQVGGEKEIFTQSLDNSSGFSPSCSLVSGSVDSSSTVDLSSNSNAGGYIEYQIKSTIVEDPSSNLNVDIGDYGTNPIMSSVDFTTVTDSMTNTLSLKVYCDTINPVGGRRNLSLSDAELRAGQDFTCDYQANICPRVFEDINANGLYNSGIDTLTTGVLVQLKSEDGNTVYSTITTNGSQQCFENMLHGRSYIINIPTPPTGDSTTGGNFQNKLVTYETSQIDVDFGYTNGAIVLNVPDSVILPAVSVANENVFTSTDISPIQVIDTRLANPGWTLTATIEDFVSQNQSNTIIPVSGAFKNAPASIQVNSGQTGGLTIGDQKTVNSTTDVMTIFSATPGFGLGNYQTSTNIMLTVPAYTRATAYQSQYIYTLF